MLLQADAFHIPLADKSVHCVVTSPPYWGLRKYSGDQSVGEYPDLGLEASPEDHIDRLVSIFRDIRRVLRDDGVVWLNYGDCYAGSGGENANTGLMGGDTIAASSEDGTRSGLWRRNPRKENISAGNLMLMPHRLAIALQDDGWIIRNDLVWFKRNPMPESVAGWRWERTREEKERIKEGGAQMTNLASMDAGISGGKDKVEWEYGDDYVLRKGSWRHTRQHEYVFMMVKSMNYYCNQEAVREKSSENTHHRGHKLSPPKEAAGANEGHGHKDFAVTTPDVLPSRNPRSVLDVPTAPYKGAHYATFPPNLIAPLIRASCPRRCCPECGQAWAPVVERKTSLQSNAGKAAERTGKFLMKSSNHPRTDADGGHGSRDVRYGPVVSTNVLDYRPTCECGHDDYVPGIVLDVFVGSGTVPMVAKELLRRWIGIDISYPYLDEQARYRSGWGIQKTKIDDLPLFRTDVLPDVEHES